ncbi:putative transposase, partial [Nitrosospira multiformis ATCC 25196]
AEARTDIFDYIERFHNPRKRRQLEMRQKQDLGLTKPSGEMG